MNKIRIVILFISLCFLYLSGIYIYRFFTFEHLTSLFHTVAIIGIPSAITAFIGFIGFFISSPDIKEYIQKQIRRILSNNRYTFSFFLVAIILFANTFFITNHIVPLKWKEFIDKGFLAGEQDSYKTAHTIVNEIKNIDSINAEILKQGILVFELRNSLNHERMDLAVKSLRQSIRFLEQEISKNKYIKAFQYFSLAEAYSISIDIKAYKFEDAHKKALQYYKLFDNNSNGIATELLSSSSKLNQANIFWYLGEYEKVYEELKLLKDSASKSINIAANYVMLDQFDNAIKEAENGIEYVNTKNNRERGNYDSLVENMMIAYLGKNNPKKAVEIFNEKMSGDFIPSGSLETTYALALLLSGNNNQFIDLLRNSKQISYFYNNFLYGVYYLIENKNSAAVQKLKYAIKVDESDDIEYHILISKVTDIIRKKGYLKNKQLSSFFEGRHEETLPRAMKDIY